jgi:hypothetical protein
LKFFSNFEIFFVLMDFGRRIPQIVCLSRFVVVVDNGRFVLFVLGHGVGCYPLLIDVVRLSCVAVPCRGKIKS